MSTAFIWFDSKTGVSFAGNGLFGITVRKVGYFKLHWHFEVRHLQQKLAMGVCNTILAKRVHPPPEHDPNPPIAFYGRHVRLYHRIWWRWLLWPFAKRPLY